MKITGSAYLNMMLRAISSLLYLHPQLDSLIIPRLSRDSNPPQVNQYIFELAPSAETAEFTLSLTR